MPIFSATFPLIRGLFYTRGHPLKARLNVIQGKAIVHHKRQYKDMLVVEFPQGQVPREVCRWGLFGVDMVENLDEYA